MNDNYGSQDNNLEEATRQQNSNLQRLIDAIGSLIGASRELLTRLQPTDGVRPPPEGDRPDADRREP